MNRTFFLNVVAQPKLKHNLKKGVKERKYFAKQIVSFRLCGEINPVLRYSSGSKNTISHQKLGTYR